MHSSRMRTGRALTVSGAGVCGVVCASQKNFFGGVNKLKKKEKKISDPLENLEQTPPLKIWVRHPPKIWVRHPPPCGQPVNLLPWPNFVAAGNETRMHSSRMRNSHSSSRPGGVSTPPRADPPAGPPGADTPLARSPSTSPLGVRLEAPLPLASVVTFEQTFYQTGSLLLRVGSVI